MASLVLGTIGAYFFGPIGFMVGSAIGNLLTPQKPQEGPRLTDLKLQGSSNGVMIPIPYGTIRLSPQVVWQTDLVEHKHTSGGKGGPQVTTYTYTVSFAVKICKGPISGVLRIWADGKIIYDTSGNSNTDNDAIPVTIYNGSETASPDPTMETALGVGNVPAFRDDAAMVFTDWDVGAFGNRIPSLSVEIYCSSGHIPWRVASFVPFGTLDVAGPNGAGPQTGAIEGGLLVISRWTGGSSCTYEQNDYTLDGVLVESHAPIVGPMLPYDDSGGPGTQHVHYCQNNPHICYGVVWGASDVNTCGGFYYDGAITVANLNFYTGAGTLGPSLVYSVHNDSVYGITDETSPGQLRRFQCTDGRVETGVAAATYDLPSMAGGYWQLTVDDVGDVWAVCSNPPLATDIACLHLDADLNLIDSWQNQELPHGSLDFGDAISNFTVYQGLVMWNDSLSLNDSVTLSRPGHPSWSLIGSTPSDPPGAFAVSDTNVISLGNGLGLVAWGIVSMRPPPGSAILGDIVADLSNRAGLDASQYDTSALTDEVPGYLVTSRTDVRADIMPLMTAYFFDCVESSGQAVFVKRGGASALTIPDDDLAARVDSDGPPPLVAVKRAQEVDLPKQVDVTYYNLDQSYQNGTQRALRQVTRSETVAEIQLAIALTDTKARQIANVRLYESWLERDTFTIALSRKYSTVEPTDVLTAGGFAMRVVNKTAAVNGVITVEGVRASDQIYIALPPGTASLAPEPVPIATPQATDLLLLDIPLVNDTDDENGFYAAMAGHESTAWRGAELDKSTDGGATYAAVANDAVIDPMGTATTALGDWSGGNVFDMLNTVTVVIGPGGGTLSSASALGVLNGANEAVIGQELVQFVTAELIATSTYKLSGLLRGRRGTEWAMPSHLVGDRFALLPVTNVPASFSELGNARKYKAVTSRTTLAAATAQTFTNNGQALRPYSPVLLGGGPITPFDGTVELHWIRRTRKGGAWNDFTEVPISETAEQYVVQIWDATYSSCARIIPVGAQLATYTAAMQVTDFGAIQQNIYWTVGQLGLYQLGTQSAAVSPGSGGADNAPLNPVPPYNSPPPPPSGGCSLPTVDDTFIWAAPVSKFNPGAGPTETWVLSFTTGAIVAGAGSINAAEYSGPATQRDAVLSTSPCGVPLTPASHQVGNTVSVIFYMTGNPYPATYPTLLPFTTYYYSINSLASSGMICNLSTPH
jgi:hypothetical protein